MKQLLKEACEHGAKCLDWDTAKVGMSASVPFAVWATNLDTLFKVLASFGAAVYIWIKIYRQIKRDK